MNLNMINLTDGLVWSVIWILLVLVLGKRSFSEALISGLVFFIWFCIFSFIFFIICQATGFCL